jgi:hypothetical protein
MSHKHDALVKAIFHDPISGNIHWREVESLLRHLGAEVESHSGTKVHVKLNGRESVLHRPHQGSLDREGVRHLREVLARAGVTPSLLQQKNEQQKKESR